MQNRLKRKKEKEKRFAENGVEGMWRGGVETPRFELFAKGGNI
jgi:hypothetical protein